MDAAIKDDAAIVNFKWKLKKVASCDDLFSVVIRLRSVVNNFFSNFLSILLYF